MWVMTFVESMPIGSYLLLGILLLFYFTIMFVSKTKQSYMLNNAISENLSHLAFIRAVPAGTKLETRNI